MLFIIICPIVGFIVGFIIGCLEGCYSFQKAFLELECTILGWLIGAFLFIAIGTPLGNALKEEKIEEQQIYAISDVSNITGEACFLRTYNIEESLRYRYMVKKENGYIIEEIDSDSVFINEISENEEPKIIKHTWVIPDWAYLFANDKLIVEDNYYEIYVPEGTIVNDFNIDLE